MYKSLFFSLTLLSFVFPSVHLTLGEVNTDSGTLEVLMANEGVVGGFQFDLTGVTVTGASGGSAGAGGFFMSTSGTTVLGFSLTGAIIPPGEGLLVEVTFSDSESEICLSSPVFSDPDGIAITTTFGECYPDDDGGGVITDGCDLPLYIIYLADDGSVFYNSDNAIGGFQFTVEGSTVASAGGGDAGDAGFMISVGGSLVLGFSLTGATFGPGCGTMVELVLNGEASGLSGIVISDADGIQIPFYYYEGGGNSVPGCTDENACNYNEEATEDDGSCEYPPPIIDCEGNCLVEIDCEGVCGGDVVVDECGDCGGNGIPAGHCDCNGNIADCNADCGGTALVDYCGVCAGGATGNAPNADLDCAGECFGNAEFDDCGECNGGNADMDCAGICFGNAAEDCNSVCGGTALVDYCGVCAGGTTGNAPNADLDCAGECFGNSEFDDCGECNGGNADMDCTGTCFGDAYEDDCFTCDDDPSNDCSEEGPGWEDNPGAYEFIANMIPMIYIDDEAQGDDGDLLGAFGADGSVRGVAERFPLPPFSPYYPGYTFDIQLRSNIVGEILTFKFYDASVSSIIDLDEIYEFVTNDIVGNVIDPFILNGSTEPSEGPHFDLTLEGTGVYQLFVFQTSITSLDDGDEIGIFDANGITNYGDCSNQYGELLVGAGTWTGEQLNISAVGSVDNCVFGGVQLAGYTESDPVIVRAWDASAEMEYETSLTFAAGNGIFGEPITVVSEITLDTGEVYGCTDAAACNHDESATVDDGSCEYEDWYYLDTDGDGLGYGTGQLFCPDDVADGWVDNYDDEAPNCTSNVLDDCGVCDGDNSSCSGCTDEDAFNYDEEAVIEDGSCIYPPGEFTFEISTMQAFYFVYSAAIDSDPLVENEDWIGVFNGDVCVGTYPWSGINTTLPAMGNDGSDWTAGYMQNGDIPEFVVYDGSENAFYPAESSADYGWENLGFFNLDFINVYPDCNSELGGSAFIDDCSDCVGGSTGLSENYHNTDGDSVCNDGAENGDADNCPNTDNEDQANFDGDGEGDSCDADDDNDGALDENDSDDFNSSVCSDVDGDSCDDCSSGSYNAADDGWDYDADGACDAGDDDDDNDGAADGADSNDNDEFACSDDDGDTCDDCSGGSYDTADDGWDYDGDGACDAGDDDDDNDGAADGVDSNDNDEFTCSDDDGDTCDDCSTGSYDWAADGWDYDSDGACDAGDGDDDNDGALDEDDSDDNNENECSDSDGDNCDDCSSGSYDPENDGADNDGDSICDGGDPDDDNDSVADGDDNAPFDPYSCLDNDGDTCDDCSQDGSPNTANDGFDYDTDGACDAGDSDDDNDGSDDAQDSDDNNEFVCNDDDGDSCDECSSGSYDSSNDGWDYDGDGACDAGDDDDDNDGANDAADSDDNNENVCSDDDGDSCDDCTNGTYDITDDGDDYDSDDICDAGDYDDDNDGIEDDWDTDPFDNFLCMDNDEDNCDDCSSGYYDPANDGLDNDSDGVCNEGDNWPNCPDDGSNPYDDCSVCNGGNTDMDQCGVCFGDDSTCSGCTDPAAFNYNCLTGNLPQDIEGSGCEEDVIVDNGSCIYTPEGFEFSQSTLQAFYFINTANIDEEGLDPLSDWVGIFKNGVCTGSWPWEGDGMFTTVPSMGDDGSDWTDGYMSVGDFPDFKIYDASEGEIFDAEPSEAIAWANNGLFTIEQLTGFSSVQYDINLHFGANLNSFYALPDDNSIENVMASIEDNVQGVIGEGTAANYAPEFGGWVGSLEYISRTTGYWIKMNDVDVLEVEGTMTDPTTVFSLHFGANLISYPFAGSAPIEETIPLDAQEYITGIIGEGVAANHLGNGMWVGSLQNLMGTKGYWFILSGATDFSYIPPNALVRYDEAVSQMPIPEGFEFNQSSQQAFYFFGDIVGAEEGDWVIAYNDNVVVGARKWLGNYTDVPVMGYDEEQYSAGYCETGDEVSFKLFRGSTGEMMLISGGYTPDWENNSIFTLGSYTARTLPENITLHSAYPNPFNPSTMVTFSLPEEMSVNIEVYDMLGRSIAKLADGIFSEGYHKLVWNAEQQSSGIYFLRLTTGSIVQTQKLMLVK